MIGPMSIFGSIQRLELGGSGLKPSRRRGRSRHPQANGCMLEEELPPRPISSQPARLKTMPFDLDRLGSLLLVYGTHLLGALVLALIGLFVAGRVERITRRGLLAAPHLDPTVGGFLSSL